MERLVIKAHSPGRHLLQMVLLGVLATVLGAALYMLGERNAGLAHAEAEAHAIALQGEVDRLSAEQETLRAQLAVLERGTQVDQEATNVVLEDLRSLQAANLELREAVAFYQGIVDPKDRTSGLEVQTLQVTGNAGTGAYHYRLVLIHITKTETKVSGTFSLVLSGAQDGQPASYSLAELTPEKDEKLKFRFRYFQEIEGDWVLPKGFSPQTVRVLLEPYKRDKVEHSLSWDEVLHTVPAG